MSFRTAYIAIAALSTAVFVTVLLLFVDSGSLALLPLLAAMILFPRKWLAQRFSRNGSSPARTSSRSR